jgi:hypothetical protein
MKTKKYYIGIGSIALIIFALFLFVGAKRSVNDESIAENSPLFQQSLEGSIHDLETSRIQSDTVSGSYSISGKIDSLNSGKGLKGIVVVLTKVNVLHKINGTASTFVGGPCATMSQTICTACPTQSQTICTACPTQSQTICTACPTQSQTICTACPTQSQTICSACPTTSGYATCTQTICSACPTMSGYATCTQTICSACPTMSGYATCTQTICSACPTMSGYATCGSSCPTINSTTCSGSTYCSSTCPTVNGTTCTGTTYCGTTCPTVNQVTCYTTCITQTCPPSSDILYDTTDDDGNYSFSGLAAASYIVTPKDSTFKFIPENRTATIVDSNATEINYSSVFNTPTSVSKSKSEQTTYGLMEAYPNPFNSSTRIQYVVQKTSFVQINVYDVSGKEVATLVSAEKYPGTYEAVFDASKLPSGIYLCRMQSGNIVQTKKVILIK